LRAGLRVDAAVDLDRDVRAEQLAHLADLVELAAQKRLAAPAGVDGHDQREVERVGLGEVIGRGARAYDEAGLAARVADRRQRVVDVRRRPDMVRASGRPGLPEPRNVLPGP